MGALDVQVKEMKSMGDAIRRLESRRDEDNLIQENIHSTNVNGIASHDKFVSLPWQAAAQQHSQQRPSYSQQSHTSDERLGSKTEESYGPSSGMTGNHYDTREPWWSKKSTKITETETEGEERKQLDERTQQRGWVPPQPPGVVLPEAADAIRRPKPPVQKQQSGDEQSVASSDDGKEREMRIDSVVAEAENSGSMASSTSQIEIQEEKSAGVEVS
ncbi:hypothetical protein BHE74_00031108 [Ensete ventricosum]|nr:hypothetical protein BHE74_00031108 [Ensete ventricosum]